MTRRYAVFASLLLCAAAGLAVILYATPWGLGLSPDSAVYAGAARSLAGGHGVSLPTAPGDFAAVVHYPPLYPFVLAAGAWAGWDLLETARWLNSFLFGANISLAGWLAFMGTGRVDVAVAAAVLTTTALPMIQTHSMLWSEPLFIFALLAGWILLLRYHRNGGHRGALVAAAAVTGSSALVRYAGSAFIVAFVAVVLLRPAGLRKHRIADAAVCSAIAALPLALWLVRNRVFSGTFTGRRLGFHPIDWSRAYGAMDTMLDWIFAPWWIRDDLERNLIAASLLALGLAAAIRVRGRAKKHGPPPAAERRSLFYLSLGTAAAVYLCALTGSISFFDYQTPLDTRLLAPIYLPLMLTLLCATASEGFPQRSSRSWSPSLVLAVIAAAALQGFSAWPWLALSRTHGIGYAARAWHESATVKKVAGLPTGTLVYSNAPDALYAVLGIAAAMIPRKTHPDTRGQNDLYTREIAAMSDDLRKRGGVVVYFNQVGWRWYLPSSEELKHDAALEAVSIEHDGTIYRLRSTPAPTAGP